MAGREFSDLDASHEGSRLFGQASVHAQTAIQLQRNDAKQTILKVTFAYRNSRAELELGD